MPAIIVIEFATFLSAVTLITGIKILQNIPRIKHAYYCCVHLRRDHQYGMEI
jgi:hypothetical protein